MNFKYSICIGLHTYFILLLEVLFMSWDFLVNGWIYITEPEGKRGSLANRYDQFIPSSVDFSFSFLPSNL